jgi:hypothetical protein
MTITLTNTSRRLKVITLVHELYCKVRGQCSCSFTPDRTPRRLAASITVPAGGVSGELDPTVLRLPEVTRAVLVGDLRVTRVVAPAVASVSGGGDVRPAAPTRGNA